MWNTAPTARRQTRDRSNSLCRVTRKYLWLCRNRWIRTGTGRSRLLWLTRAGRRLGIEWRCNWWPRAPQPTSVCTSVSYLQRQGVQRRYRSPRVARATFCGRSSLLTGRATWRWGCQRHRAAWMRMVHLPRLLMAVRATVTSVRTALWRILSTRACARKTRLVGGALS